MESADKARKRAREWYYRNRERAIARAVERKKAIRAESKIGGTV